MNFLSSGIFLVILNTFCLAFLPIFSKMIFPDIGIFFMMFVAWGIAGVFFLFYLLLEKQNPLTLWKQSTNKISIIAPAIIIGIGAHGCIFYGLQFTSAGNMTILAASEMLFSYLLFHFWHAQKEKSSHLLGSVFMFIGIVVVLWEQIETLSFNKGDVILLVGFALAPFGNFFQKKALANGEKSAFLLLVRSILVAPFFAIIFFFSSELLPPVSVFQENLFWLIGIGLIPLGIGKIFWIEGIKRISIPKASSLNLIVPLITIFLAYFLLSEVPTIYQILSLIPICIGVLLLVRK